MADAVLPIGQGTLLTRMFLRQQLRKSTDAKEKAAISAAIADATFADDLAAEGMAATGSQGPIPGGLGGLLQWLLANLPQIIALIMALFGGG